MHLADTGALCMDIGYQLGQVACEALRTIVINTTQRWCGNRFAKGLIRFGGTHYPLTDDLKMLVLKNLNEVETRYAEVVHSLQGTSSVLARFEDCGVVTRTQALRIGAVGMAARASGLVRDIRQTHPRGAYGKLIAHDPVAENSGDVYARLRVRMREVAQSAGYVRDTARYARLRDARCKLARLPDGAGERCACFSRWSKGGAAKCAMSGLPAATGSSGSTRYTTRRCTTGRRWHFRYAVPAFPELSHLQQKFQPFLLRP